MMTEIKRVEEQITEIRRAGEIIPSQHDLATSAMAVAIETFASALSRFDEMDDPAKRRRIVESHAESFVEVLETAIADHRWGRRHNRWVFGKRGR